MKSALQQRTALQQVTLSLQGVTPIAIHGAMSDERKKMVPELRIPSLKGMIRYWYRASQDGPIDVIREQEVKLFGGALGSQKQKSMLRLSMSEPETCKKVEFRPSHSKGFTISALQVNGWDIHLSAKKTEKGFEEAVATVKFAFAVGGVGQRARRGAGSLQTEVYKDSDAYLTDVRTQLDILGTPYSREGGLLRATTLVKTDRPQWRQTILIEKTYDTAEEALKKLRLAAHNASEGALHSALGKVKGGRYASPLHATVKHFKDGYRVIVTEVSQTTRSPHPQFEKAKNRFMETLMS